MTHRRTMIKQALFNAIDAKTLVAKTYINKVVATSDNDLPCILIRTTNESVDIYQESPRVYKRSFEAEIEIIVIDKEKDEVEIILDQVTAQIEDVLGPDETLNGVLENLVLKSTEYAFNNENKFLQGHALMTFDCEYTTEVKYPEISDEYSGSNTDWKIKGSDKISDTNQVETI